MDRFKMGADDYLGPFDFRIGNVLCDDIE